MEAAKEHYRLSVPCVSQFLKGRTKPLSAGRANTHAIATASGRASERRTGKLIDCIWLLSQRLAQGTGRAIIDANAATFAYISHCYLLGLQYRLGEAAGESHSGPEIGSDKQAALSDIAQSCGLASMFVGKDSLQKPCVQWAARRR